MIEVGEFVRTDDGIIGKIKRIELDNTDKTLKWYVFDRKRLDMNMTVEAYINKPYIVKYSKNIIDLIEVGDYVNGYKVISIDTNAPNDCKECIELDRNNTYEYQWISRNEIKTILTKELYQANCYTVERKEE